jgi:23S rRNA A2030 N6-methylase RlmJ
MANRHFAKLGDVWKHLPLAEVLRLNPPQAYWETHAGSLFYPLSASSARLHGALRFLSRASSDPDLLRSSYLEALQAQPGMYPGSPALALRQLGTNASYVFCDTDPESAAGLRKAGRPHHVRVVEEDGVSAIAREAERMEFEPRDVLVHIDPYDPHERFRTGALTPVELAASLARRGYRLFYWYGYESVSERGWARHAISHLTPDADLWCGDMLMPASFVYPERDGAFGCGIVLANMSAIEAATCARLGTALERISADDLAPNNDPACLSFMVIAGD